MRDVSIFPFLGRCLHPPHFPHTTTIHPSVYSMTCYEMNYFVIAWVETQFFMVVTHFLESLVVFLLCMIICISLWVLSLRRGDRRDRTTQWCLYDSHEFWWDNINSRDITPQTPTTMYNNLLIWYYTRVRINAYWFENVEDREWETSWFSTSALFDIFKVAAIFWDLKTQVLPKNPISRLFSSK